jgi:hypothetical protein
MICLGMGHMTFFQDVFFLRSAANGEGIGSRARPHAPAPKGGQWGPMGTHRGPWGPMGTHGGPWGPWDGGAHGCHGPTVPLGAVDSMDLGVFGRKALNGIRSVLLR